MLDALANNLMDPEAVQLFCEEYAAELNRMQAAATAGRAGLEKEMAQVTRDHRKLVDAIIACVPGEQVKDRMVDLDTRRKEIERRLSDAPSDPVRLQPSMAPTCQKRAGVLIQVLADAERMEEAEALRALVERIVLTPAVGSDRLAIDPEGALAALLRLATRPACKKGPVRKGRGH